MLVKYFKNHNKLQFLNKLHLKKKISLFDGVKTKIVQSSETNKFEMRAKLFTHFVAIVNMKSALLTGMLFLYNVDLDRFMAAYVCQKICRYFAKYHQACQQFGARGRSCVCIFEYMPIHRYYGR